MSSLGVGWFCIRHVVQSRCGLILFQTCPASMWVNIVAGVLFGLGMGWSCIRIVGHSRCVWSFSRHIDHSRWMLNLYEACWPIKAWLILWQGYYSIYVWVGSAADVLACLGVGWSCSLYVAGPVTCLNTKVKGAILSGGQDRCVKLWKPQHWCFMCLETNLATTLTLRLPRNKLWNNTDTSLA